METDGSDEVGERVREARRDRKWSQARLAREAGISQPAIRKIEGGKTRKSKYMPDIARALGKRLSELDASFANKQSASLTGAPLEVEPQIGERDLPVQASAEGGDGTLVISTDPVDYVRRPARLLGVKDGYGLIIINDSMRPELKAGETALVHPHLPPIPDECCIFYADDGHGAVRATVKSVARVTSTHWHVEQWNPPKKFALSRKEWQTCHRVVGKYSRR